jgi:ABC-type multidrug transport system permease subunit
LSIQGLQNQMFAIFQVLTVFGQLVQMQVSLQMIHNTKSSLTDIDASLRHSAIPLRSA